MIARIDHNGNNYMIDLAKPIDISISIRASADNVCAWYQDPPKIEPVRMGNWVGEVAQGAAVNFRNVLFNPHAHGTHTESVGHISKEFYPVNKTLAHYFFMAQLITVSPEKQGDDMVITFNLVKELLENKKPEAIVIRTSPNPTEKSHRQYSNTNPPYLEAEAAEYFRSIGVKHLLIDLPSVDKEKDEGRLSAHRAFWNYPAAPRIDCTITELIYVPDKVTDGAYLLNLQVANFENDAAPSRPLLFSLI